MSPAQKVLRRAQFVPLVLAVLYGIILFLATVPWVQRECVSCSYYAPS